MNTLDLLTIGDCSIDQYMHVEDATVVCDLNKKDCEICFKYDAKIPVKDFSASIAGNACNVAVGCTTLGMNVAVYTIVGNDGNGQKFIEEFNSLGVNTKYIQKDDSINTDVHTVIVHEGERTIFSYHSDKNYKIQPWTKPKWLYYTSMCKNFEEFQAELVEYLTKNRDIGVAFNPGTYHFQAGTEAMKNILKVVNVLFVNKKEAQNILNTKEEDFEKLHKGLQMFGPKITVITDGINGASAFFRDKYYFENAVHVNNVVDKTGAGDSFATGVLAALHYNKPLDIALKWGVQNSAHVIQEPGSIHGLLDRNHMEKLVLW